MKTPGHAASIDAPTSPPRHTSRSAHERHDRAARGGHYGARNADTIADLFCRDEVGWQAGRERPPRTGPGRPRPSNRGVAHAPTAITTPRIRAAQNAANPVWRAVQLMIVTPCVSVGNARASVALSRLARTAYEGDRSSGHGGSGRPGVTSRVSSATARQYRGADRAKGSHVLA